MKEQIGFGEYLKGINNPHADYWLEGEDKRKENLNRDLLTHYFETRWGKTPEEFFKGLTDDGLDPSEEI